MEEIIIAAIALAGNVFQWFRSRSEQRTRPTRTAVIAKCAAQAIERNWADSELVTALRQALKAAGLSFSNVDTAACRALTLASVRNGVGATTHE